MNNILSTLMLVLSLGVAMSTNAQTEKSSVEADSIQIDQEVTRVCYNSTVFAIHKEGEDVKKKKKKFKENCFEFSQDGTVTMTNHRGRIDVFEVTDYQIISNENNYAYIIQIKSGNNEMEMVVDYKLTYVCIYKQGKRKGKATWYFTSLE